MLYLFKLKNTNFAKKIKKLNKNIKAQNNKPKINFLILIKIITKILLLYKKVKENNTEAKIN